MDGKTTFLHEILVDLLFIKLLHFKEIEKNDRFIFYDFK